MSAVLEEAVKALNERLGGAGFDGSAKFDIDGEADERKMERQLIADYENTVAELLETLTEDNHDLAVKIASIPEQIRGYGHVKEEHIEKARTCEEDLLGAWRSTTGTRAAA